MLWFKFAISLLLLVQTLQLASQSEYTNGNYEGDIILTNENRRTLEILSNPSDPFAPQNAVVRNQQQLWPNATVPYELHSNLHSQARTAIEEAMEEYHTKTCVRFIPRTDEEDYVIIFLGRGCYSYVGRITGPQYMSIGYGCGYKGIVMHEMFHALGRWHEQSRPDRDLFVRILTENILNGTEYNFERKNRDEVTTQGIPYDISSIMHYRYNAFTRNGDPTILPLDTSIDRSNLGQRDRLSDLDLQHVQTLYCGGGGSLASWSSWEPWTTCSQTCNGGSRTRLRACVGGATCEGSNIQSQQCYSASCPVEASWGTWSAWSGCSNTCGGGRRSKTRPCVGGNICVGIRALYETCNSQDCPLPAIWASWGSWSSCSSTCQGGFKQRRRICNNGNNCPGVDVRTSDCNTWISCETTKPSGEWSSWSKCSAECGGGSRFRVRNCESGSNTCQTEKQSCNTEDCVPEPELRGLRYRGCWYLNARARKIGSFEGTTPDLTDLASTRIRPVSKCGTAVQREDYQFFGVTEGYCLSGSNNLEDYQYYASDLCRDGKGAYSRENGGWFIMDVYQIINQASFSDSVIQINAPNVTTDVNDMMTTGTGSGHALTSNLALLVSAILTVVLAIAVM